GKTALGAAMGRGKRPAHAADQSCGEVPADEHLVRRRVDVGKVAGTGAVERDEFQRLVGERALGRSLRCREYCTAEEKHEPDQILLDGTLQSDLPSLWGARAGHLRGAVKCHDIAA